MERSQGCATVKPRYDDGFARMFVGDAIDVLSQMPEKSVHCVVTSPPYFGLRSYLPSGHPDKAREGGTQETPELYTEWLVQVFRTVWKVLRDDGTLWLNLGDSYAANRTYQVSDSKHKAHDFAESNAMRVPAGLKPKDLLMIPARVALALQQDGWYLRRDIIWAKDSAMPESVSDRPSSAHEYIFLLTKKPRYYYDKEAIAEPSLTIGDSRHLRTDNTQAFGRNGDDSRLRTGNPTGPTRNARSVWRINPRPYPGSHYAVFPEEIPRRAISAGTSERGVCSECGAPYVRVVERQPESQNLRSHGTHPGTKHLQGPASRLNSGTAEQYHANRAKSRTIGFNPTCSHDAEIQPAVVLDCFSGSGTTGLVARKLGRKSILIDLDERNVKLLEERLVQGVLL